MKFLNLKVFSVVLILGIGISSTFWLKENANSAERDKRELVVNTNLESAIQWNTKQINSLGVNSVVEMQNSELLIQILNVLEGNEVKSVPKEIPLGDLKNPEIELSDVPITFEQLTKDQREVDTGIRAAASNNLFQNQALHNILNKLINEKPLFEEGIEETTFPLTFPLLYSPEESNDLL